MSIQSLDRTFDVIEYLAIHPVSGNLSTIAAELGLPVSTVYRITRDLTEVGYLRKDGNTGTYSIGLKFVDLARPNLRNLELKTEANPFLSALSRRLESRVFLAIMSDNQLCYIDSFVQSATTVRQSIIGKKRPMFSTGLGKALLMGRSDEDIRAMMEETGLVAYTPYTITDPDRFIEQMRVSRKRGWAEDYQEDNLDCCCIAAPISDSNGRTVASISSSWNAERFTALDREKTAAVVMETAADISSMLSPVFLPE